MHQLAEISLHNSNKRDYGLQEDSRLPLNLWILFLLRLKQLVLVLGVASNPVLDPLQTC